MTLTISRGQRQTKTTCKDCKHTVHLVDVAGQRTAVDPELISVVSGRGMITARRIHAELCDVYQREMRRAKTRAEIQAYERRRSRSKGL